MAGFVSMDVHGVRAIELTAFMQANSNCRTLTITTDDGVFELNVYGKTEGLAAVPQSFDYRTPYSPLEIHELAQAAE